MSVDVSSAAGVVRIRLHRPDKLNAFDTTLVDGAAAALAEAEVANARLVVFEGSGKGFSGGFDLSDLDSSSDGDLALRLIRIEMLLQAVYHSPCATLALVYGPCYGAAADLVLACRDRVATADARFRMPGARFGIVLGTRRLTAAVGADAARQLVLRDKPFGAEEARATGFVTQIADRDAWGDCVAAALDRASALSPDTYAALTARMVEDTRDADLAALVRSAAQGDLTARIRGYLDQVAKARATKG